MSVDNEFIWWKHGVIYHIYPRSYFDSSNNGNGDIRGIIQKLPYLNRLGVDAIWLSPVYDSPLHDNGYDIRDYRKIDKIFGNLDDFKELLDKAHDNDIRVIMDMVLNHTSIEHPWFIESRSSIDNPKRDWYLWRKGKNRFTPNNWRSAFGGSAWEYDKHTDEYYLHTFFKEQPDLNWRNKSMRNAFFEEIRYWLDLGVDGFRLDVINMIIKDKKFRNNTKIFNLLFPNAKSFSRNRPKSYKIVRKLRKLTNNYPNKTLIGEIYNTPPGNSKLVASYLGNGNDSLNMAFDFSIFFKGWSAKKYNDAIENLYMELPDKGWPCFVFSNHDLNRSISRFGSHSEKKALLTAVLMFTLKGTPFIYYGEEIGMKNIKLRKSKLNDPLGKKYWPLFKGRDGSRTPMQWNNQEHAGFSKVKPWLPVSPDFTTTNVEVQENMANSLLRNYQTLISIRKKYPSLLKGDWKSKGTSNNIMSYQRNYGDEIMTIILNFSSKNKTYLLSNNQYRYIYTTHPETLTDMVTTTITLQPFQAIILELINKPK